MRNRVSVSEERTITHFTSNNLNQITTGGKSFEHDNANRSRKKKGYEGKNA